MALLATEGVGVFDKKHVVISAPRSVVALRGQYGTHQFAWECLECWSTKKTSGSLFARVIKPYGRSLDDWLSPIGGGIVAAPQAERWFLQWGMDLKMPLDDRNARNESSYRPDGLPSAWNLRAHDTLTFVRGIWSTLEPAADSRFDNIDRHILRIVLENVFRGRRGIEPSQDPARFGQDISEVVENQNLAPETERQWIQFLKRQVVKDDPTIFSLSRQTPKIRENSHAAIIARATLLLRVASGSTADLFQSVGLNADSIAFWWNDLGKARGLWDGSRTASELVDLWADIGLVLQDVDAFQDKHSAADQTFFRVGRELGQAIVALGSCERVAIWSMAL